MSDPSNLPVARSAKKAKVAERTIAERKYCAIDQYYYSEMFTCPICYGAKRERESIIKFLEDEADKFDAMRPEWYKSVADKMDLRIRTIRAIAKKLKGEQNDNEETT